MKLVTLKEAKDRLSIDFDYKDNEITQRVNGIEGYISIATGSDLIQETDEFMSVGKEYVLLNLYLDYYNAHNELDDSRLTKMMKQLQVVAL